MTYAEKLQDPKWQKKRLSVFERDNYTCQLCFDTETTLHIHHKFYHRDKEPWDYDDEDLVTYCKHCHALVEHLKTVENFSSIIEVIKYSHHTQFHIVCLLRNIKNEKYCSFFTYEFDAINFWFLTPMHIISRINFSFETLNQKENG